MKAGRLVVNLLVVWAATGIWHGASWNFLLWGLFYGVLIILEKFFLGRWLDRAPRWLGHVYGLLVVMVGWAIFAVEDFAAMGLYLKAMFGMGAGLADGAFFYYLRNYLPMLLLGCVAATPLASTLWKKTPSSSAEPLTLRFESLSSAAWTVSNAYLVDGTYNPFLYFRF